MVYGNRVTRREQKAGLIVQAKEHEEKAIF